MHNHPNPNAAEPSMESSTKKRSSSRLPLSPRSINADNILKPPPPTIPNFSMLRSRFIKKNGGAFFGRKHNEATNDCEAGRRARPTDDERGAIEAGENIREENGDENSAPSHHPRAAASKKRGIKIKVPTPRSILGVRNQECKSPARRTVPDGSVCAIVDFAGEQRGPVPTDIVSEQASLLGDVCAAVAAATVAAATVPMDIDIEQGDLRQTPSGLSNNNFVDSSGGGGGGIVTRVMNMLTELDGLCVATKCGSKAVGMVLVSPRNVHDGNDDDEGGDGTMCSAVGGRLCTGIQKFDDLLSSGVSACYLPPTEEPVLNYSKGKERGRDDGKPMGKHNAFASTISTRDGKIYERDLAFGSVDVPFQGSWPDADTLAVITRAKDETRHAVAGVIKGDRSIHERALEDYKDRVERELELVATKPETKIENYRMELMRIEMQARVEELRGDMRRKKEEDCGTEIGHPLDNTVHQEEMIARGELEKAHRAQAREESKSARLKDDLEAESEQKRKVESQIIQLRQHISDRASLADRNDDKSNTDNDMDIEMVKKEVDRTITSQTEELEASENKFLRASTQNSKLESEVGRLTREIRFALAPQRSLNADVQRTKEEAGARLGAIAEERGELEESLANAGHRNGVLKEQVAKLTEDIGIIQMINAQNNKLEGLRADNAIDWERSLTCGESSDKGRIGIQPTSNDIESPRPTHHAVEVEYFPKDAEVSSSGEDPAAAAGPADGDVSLPFGGNDGDSTARENSMALTNANSNVLASSSSGLASSASATVNVERGKIAWFRKLMAGSFSSEADDDDDNSRTASTFSYTTASKTTAGSKTTIEGVVPRFRSKKWLPSRSSGSSSSSRGMTDRTSEDGSTSGYDRSEAASSSQSALFASSAIEKPTEWVVRFKSKKRTQPRRSSYRGTTPNGLAAVDTALTDETSSIMGNIFM